MLRITKRLAVFPPPSIPLRLQEKSRPNDRLGLQLAQAHRKAALAELKGRQDARVRSPSFLLPSLRALAISEAGDGIWGLLANIIIEGRVSGGGTAGSSKVVKITS